MDAAATIGAAAPPQPPHHRAGQHVLCHVSGPRVPCCGPSVPLLCHLSSSGAGIGGSSNPGGSLSTGTGLPYTRTMPCHRGMPSPSLPHSSNSLPHCQPFSHIAAKRLAALRARPAASWSARWRGGRAKIQGPRPPRCWECGAASAGRHQGVRRRGGWAGRWSVLPGRCEFSALGWCALRCSSG